MPGVTSGKVLVPTVALLFALVAACGGDDAGGGLSFDEAVDAGEPCDVLFEIRNEFDPDSPLIESANERLRSIGCFSSTSERTDR